MNLDEANVSQVPDCDADVEQVLRDLEVRGCILPVEAIRAAQRLGPRIVPGLISLIKSATREAREGRTPETNGFFFALFLLIEFRAKEGWPAILEAAMLPGEWTSALFGSGVEAAFPQAVMTMAHDRIEEVVSVIRNEEVDEFMRWSFISGLAFCIVDGSHSREEIVGLLRELLRECLDRKGADNSLALVLTLMSLYPREALLDIQKAFDEGLVDYRDVCADDVLDQIDEGEEATMLEFAEEHRPIRDTAETLGEWICFQPLETRQPVVSEPRPRLTQPLPPPPAPEPTNQIRNSGHHVGRNDPCPCGSGKKFKKCCSR